jgi:hypothetical protein
MDKKTRIRNGIGMLLGACLVAAALPGSSPIIRGDTQNVLERINEAPLSPKAPMTAKAGQAIVLVGWAFDSHANSIASSVEAEVKGQTFRAEYGIARPDVAQVFHNPGLEKSGYRIVIPKGQFGPGEYQVRLRIGAARQPGYYAGRNYLLRIY